MITCLDCGEPSPEPLDLLPLCSACHALALHLIGSAEQRVQILEEQP